MRNFPLIYLHDFKKLNLWVLVFHDDDLRRMFQNYDFLSQIYLLQLFTITIPSVYNFVILFQMCRLSFIGNSYCLLTSTCASNKMLQIVLYEAVLSNEAHCVIILYNITLHIHNIPIYIISLYRWKLTLNIYPMENWYYCVNPSI